MVHINVIPLNLTKYNGSPSQRHRVDTFVDILQNEFSITCTPRGCRQIKSKVLLQQQQLKGHNEQEQQQSIIATSTGSSGPFTVGFVTTSTTSTEEQGSDEVVPNLHVTLRVL
jgi:hypothetical protein